MWLEQNEVTSKNNLHPKISIVWHSWRVHWCDSISDQTYSVYSVAVHPKLHFNTSPAKETQGQINCCFCAYFLGTDVTHAALKTSQIKQSQQAAASLYLSFVPPVCISLLITYLCNCGKIMPIIGGQLCILLGLLKLHLWRFCKLSTCEMDT